MSPLAALAGGFLSPLLLAAIFLVEWWANWFVFGREFRRTLALTLLANLLSLGGGGLLLASGALGEPAAEAPLAVWAAAALGLYAAHLALEAAVVQLLMPRWRPRWEWDRYDFGVFAAAQAFGFLGLALQRLLADSPGLSG